MAIAERLHLVTVTVLALGLVACDLSEVLVGREWIIVVENESDEPARLVVANDEVPIGEVVGWANPPVVAPRSTMEVTFSVPTGERWAIFVNPGPETGALLTAGDLPAGGSGRLPITIVIDSDGNPSTRRPAQH
jgi:hypothetical protein